MAKRLTIASYPGGKSSKTKHKVLYETFYTYTQGLNIDILVEPFAGLANFFLNVRDLVENAVLSDANPKVVSLLKVIKNEPEALINITSDIKKEISPEVYYQWREFEKGDDFEALTRKIQDFQPFKRIRRREIKICDSILKWENDFPYVLDAASLITVLNCSVNGAGGGFSKSKAKRNWVKKKMWMEISEVFRIWEVTINNHSYQQTETRGAIKDGNDVLYYLDPPYYQVANKGKLYGKNFSGFSTIEENKEITEWVKKHSLDFILSTRDCKDMRDLWKDYTYMTYNSYNDMSNKRGKNPELVVSSF